MVMERIEPVLVPEWLKSSGGVISSASTNHQNSSLSSQSDDNCVSKLARNNSPVSSDHDIGCASALDRTTSSYFRRSSSSKVSALSRTHSSFGRGHHDKGWEKDIKDYHDKDKPVFGEHSHDDHYDPLSTILLSRFEKDMLHRSQSMTSGKRGDTWSRKVAGDLTHAKKSNRSDGITRLAGVSAVSSVHNSAFERDFPSLGAEESQGGPEISRVSSPGLSTSIQSFPVGTSSVIGSDGWTSALAEVPVVMGTSTTGVASAQQSVSASSAPLSPSVMSGLNMAETLVQGPSRARTPPLSTVGTQRLEELAIRQSRQLIPMTPSMPKPLVVSPSEKSKPKIGPQQHLLQTVNHTRGGPARPDSPKTSNDGRLQILKSSRDLNGASSAPKDSSSPTSGNKAVNSPRVVTSSATGSTPLRSSSNSPNFSIDRNPAPFRVSAEKRPISQAQSRNDFFSLLKKKSSTSFPSTVLDPGSVVSPSASEKSDKLVREVTIASCSLHCGDSTSSEISAADFATDNKGELNGIAYDVSQECLSNGEKHSSPGVILYPDEEEAFLRSLGWEENGGEDEGLTEEEISAFLKEYTKLKPSSKPPHGMEVGIISNSSYGVASSGSSASDAGSESSLTKCLI
ncbi:hypothetical protein CFOL_v3_10874 [Cephalotus follicularis]|uniref:Uncharacterized protein n=1 Tax=Cephalotus follicularis TaxID=3775 RepID=A0A1Q3BHH1_CEPFO|nr:hypothetical protein CFOL_v3_10874 [Cephalotus follicularis]